MTTDSFFALAVAAVIALFFGAVVAFAGYRFFLVLLPIWGFFFGFGLGAQTVQALLGEGFLGTITSWAVGFVVALVFAALSYLFYFLGVGLLAGALGYALGVGVVEAFGLDFGFLAWLVGVITGVVVAVGALVLNLQKWVIIGATALLGAGIIVGTFLFLFGGLPSTELVQNPVRHVLQTSPGWLLVFLALAALGVAAQYLGTRRGPGWEPEAYDRWAAPPPVGTTAVAR
jgi:Domain of unknown function (DUF4203)